MEQVKAPRKALFVFVWGVLLWGGSSALAITLFNYTTHHVETFYEVVGRFVIFMAAGILFGLSLWDRLEAQRRKKLPRTANILRLVLFISLMLGLTYVLWTMTRH
jgi:drug/metabolite transporter (DMT)-like permease